MVGPIYKSNVCSAYIYWTKYLHETHMILIGKVEI